MGPEVLGVYLTPERWRLPEFLQFWSIQIAVSGTTAPNNPNVAWATASIETSAGATALTASSTADTLTLRAGSNVAITTEPARNIIQIAAIELIEGKTGSSFECYFSTKKKLKLPQKKQRNYLRKKH